MRFLLSPQAGCLVEVIDAILHRVHVYTRVNRFQEKAEYFLVDPGLDVFDDNDAADSIEQVRWGCSKECGFSDIVAHFFSE